MLIYHIYIHHLLTYDILHIVKFQEIESFFIKGTHNQSQSVQTQIIKSLFSIQIWSINLTLGTVKPIFHRKLPKLRRLIFA